MEARINYMKASPKLGQILYQFGQASQTDTLPAGLLDLVNIRASQINGCAFCLDMHAKEAKIRGERELRLHHVAIWQESPLFTDQERAALEWTEAVTRLPAGGIPGDLYARTRAHFSEKELSDLTYAVGLINMWNRLNVSFQTVPGSADSLLGLDKAGLH